MYEWTFIAGDRLEHRGCDYLSFLRLINAHLQPRSYFEIGTYTGDSLNCFGCDAVCVDPSFHITSHVWHARRRSFMFQCGSDDFFSRENLRAFFPEGPDVTFLDGMHRAEYLLRDFMNTERMSHKRSLILLHDCLPMNTRMAERVMRIGDESEGDIRGAWTGDVWRVLFALAAKRPDLRVRYFDCPPTGLIAISNLDPSSTVLHDNYEAIADLMLRLELDTDTLHSLWGMHPFVKSQALAANPSDLSAVLNCR